MNRLVRSVDGYLVGFTVKKDKLKLRWITRKGIDVKITDEEWRDIEAKLKQMLEYEK